MLTEPSYLWFVRSEGTDTHAVLIKASANVLKSIISGAKVRLVCGVSEISADEKHLCLALRIFDDADCPLNIFKVLWETEEYSAFFDILKREATPLFLFDDLNHCVAWAECRLDKSKVVELLELIGDASKLYAGEFNEKTLQSLDCIDFTVNRSQAGEGVEIIPTVDIELTFKAFEFWTIHNFSMTENHPFEIDSADEGGALEQRIWTALESIFPFGISRSPQVYDGSNKRELTDILAFAEESLLLVEAKALSIFSAKPEKDMQRKVKSLKKHVDKALKQLAGAVKQIRKNRVVDSADREITFSSDQKLVPHALVVVSEILPFGEWSRQAEEALRLSEENHALFQIIGISELMKIVVASSHPNYDLETKIRAFDYYLSERFDGFVKSRSIFTQVKFDG